MIFIRIKVKGYLKNITENETVYFEEKGIKNKDKISYISENVKTSIKINGKNLILNRDGNDFVNTFIFKKDNSECNYLIKENNILVDIDIKLISMSISENNINIKYIVVDSNCEYEYNVEMSDE